MSQFELPSGLDPVTAGRFGLWLLGKRSHARAQRRRGYPFRVGHDTLAHRFACLLAPWRLDEYPGYRRLLAELLCTTEGRARNLATGSEVLPPRHARHLSVLARDRAALLNALAEDLDRHAAEREAVNAQPRGFNRSRTCAAGETRSPGKDNRHSGSACRTFPVIRSGNLDDPSCP